LAKRQKALFFAGRSFTLTVLALFSMSILGGTAFARTNAVGAHYPRFAYRPLHKLANPGKEPIRAASGALQTWTSSFTSGGQNFPYTMVGTDPHKGSATTTIPVDIVPLIFTFSDGSTSDGTSITSNIASSPLFKSDGPYNTGDTTQYVDAIQRAEFWSSISSNSSNYHLLLGQPTIQPAVNLSVPAASGSSSSATGGNAQVDIDWFSPQADSLATSSSALSPSHLTIFAAVDIDMYQGDPSQCCIGGYHTAVQDNSGNTFTYSYASFDTAPGGAFSDVAALSHELAEWANDPLTNNTVPSWSVPAQPQYGCSSTLEVGDPLVGNTFTMSGYNLQDEAFFSWFSRDTPSQGYNGRYDYQGSFSTYSSGC
jgi:hypothetical protein